MTYPTYLLRIARYQPVRFVGVIALRVLIFSAAPLATGLVTRQFFNALTGNAPAGWNVWTLCAAFLGVAAARLLVILADITLDNAWNFDVPQPGAAKLAARRPR